MHAILNIANWLLPLAYMALLIDYGARFLLRTRTEGRSVLLPAVLAAHAATLVLLGAHLGRMVPANNFEVLSVLAAATAAMYWLVELRTGDRRTGGFVLLVVFLLQYTASIFLRGELAGMASETASPSWHVIPAMVAYTGFTVSAVYGVLYIWARRDLKRRRFGLLFDRLPSLDLLGLMNWHAMVAGFAFMTVAIVSGAMMYSGSPSAAGAMTPNVFIKIFAGITAWVIYASAIVGKFVQKWDRARVCGVTVIGFAVVAAMLAAGVILS